MVYVVGGFVRDLLLTQATRGDAFDMDIVIEGDAIAFAEQMQARYGGRIVPHRRFGTAKWLLDDAEYPLQQTALLDQLGVGTALAALPPHPGAGNLPTGRPPSQPPGAEHGRWRR